MSAFDDLDRVIEQSHLGLDAFFKGDPEPVKALFSHREDVSLANPFGPPVRGWRQLLRPWSVPRRITEMAVRRASNASRSTRPLTSPTSSRERFEAKLGGREDVSPLALRVTTVLRPEDGGWKIVHRHADPITTARPAESVIPS